jgi:hypothetical protein
MSVKFTALFIVFSLLLFSAGTAQAQTAGVVTLRANSTSAQGSLVPVLTWSTNPVATSCRASGGWSGNKGVSGSETLARISGSTNYTLTCTWGSGSARVSWVAPTQNTDGTTLANLAGFRVYYSTSNTSFSTSTLVNDTTSRTTTINALPAGTWYFMVRVLNSGQVESGNSNVASKAVSGATAANTVSISITSAPPPTPPPPTPPPPTPPPSSTSSLKTIETAVYEVVPVGNNWGLGRVVGSIALGRPCSLRFDVNSTHDWVDRTYVTLTATPRTSVTVARCALR